MRSTLMTLAVGILVIATKAAQGAENARIDAGEDLLPREGGRWDGDPGDITRAGDLGTSASELCTTPLGTDHSPGERAVAPPMPALYADNRLRNRYLAFDPNPDNLGTNVAFKVTLTSIRIGSCDGSGIPNIEGWPCRTDDDCRACSTSQNACWSAPLHCPPGQTCNLTGAVCLIDHTVDPGNFHHSVGRSWWVGPQHPMTGVHLLVTPLNRRVSNAWPNPVIVADCEVVPTGVYNVVTVTVPAGMQSAPLEVKAAEKPNGYWADCVGPLGDHCDGNWRPCATPADCGFCYDWQLGPGNPNNGSTLTPCISHADCNACSITGGPCMYDSDCPPGEACLRSGEWCGFACFAEWPPPDGFINFQDVAAAIFTFGQIPGFTTTDVPNVDLHGGINPNVDPPNYRVDFNDIGWMVKAFNGYPYPFNDPGDCPDVANW